MITRRTWLSRALALLAASLVPSLARARSASALPMAPRDPDPGDNAPGVGDMAVVRALEDFRPPHPATRIDRRVAIRRDGYTTLYTIVVTLYGETLRSSFPVFDRPLDSRPERGSPRHLVEVARRSIAWHRDHPPAHLMVAANALGYALPVPA